MPLHQTYLAAIKSFEGFAPQAKWDYAQHSNGYGTKALYPGEQIDAAEAERRFAAELAIARDIVDKHAAGWDEGTKAALTSLTFNAGTRWISSGLGDAVRNGDIEGIRERFVQYTKAQGEVLPGLLKRRLAEVDWIGSGAGGAPPTAQATTLAGPAPALQTLVQPTQAVGPSSINPTDTPVATLTDTERSDVAAVLRDQLAGLSSAEATDARAAQNLSMLITLLFDMQMRAAVGEPRDGGEPANGQPQHSI